MITIANSILIFTLETSSDLSACPNKHEKKATMDERKSNEVHYLENFEHGIDLLDANYNQKERLQLRSILIITGRS